MNDHSRQLLIERTFFDLPADENSDIETAETLADFATGGRIGWSTLLESERVLIVSEAGMGKTYECQRQRQKLWDEERSAFFVELTGLATDPLERQFSTEERERFNNWIEAQNERAFFFLDSIDELKLTRRSFETTLKQFAAALGDNLGRACIVLTTRPTAFDQEIVRRQLPIPPTPDVFVPEDYFANVAMSVSKDEPAQRSHPEWRFVALSALDGQQMHALAVTEGVSDADALLAAVNAYHMHDFAKRPLDFLELCGDWKEHGRIRSHREQVDSSIDIKLRARSDRQERTQLSPRRVRDGAGRLALAVLLCRKFTLWHSTDSDRARGDATLDPAKILVDWPDDEVKTLLERSLFGFATYGRVRFHNRSIVEFLAAERLKLLVERGLPVRTLKRLLFATTPEGQKIVKPSLQPVAAWLALHIPDVRSELLEREPSILLRYGDPGSLNPTLRAQALERYVQMYGADGWRGQRIPSLQVQRFATNDLSEVIKRLWSAGIENPEVREVLLELIGAGRMIDCADIAHGVATDLGNDAHDRLYGLLALAQLQDSRLPALLDLISSSSPDWPERLAQSVVFHLFPQHLSVPQLVKTLARLTPKPRETVGIVSALLPSKITEAELEPRALIELQQGLAEIVLRSCCWNDHLYRTTSERQDLVPALLAANQRCLEFEKIDPNLFDAIALAGLLANDDYYANDETEALRSVLADASSEARAGVFFASDHFLRKYCPKDKCDPFFRFHQFWSYGAYQIQLEKDSGWILGTLSDVSRPLVDREVALEAAISYANDHTDRLSWLREVVEASCDSETLENRAKESLDVIENPGPPPAWLIKKERRREKSRRKHAKDLASWKMFWRELNNDSETAFSEKHIDTTSWNLWCVMQKDSHDHSFAGWNRGFIERVFDKSMADRVKAALAAVWRKDQPTLKSERPADQKNSYLMRWRMGLTGIYAESEDSLWASRLTADEARLACRYALLDLKLPPWLEAVAHVHPDAVDATIGEELLGELRDADTKHSVILQDISHASPAIIALFLDRIRSWLKDTLVKGESSIQKNDKIGRAINLLLDRGNEEDATYVREISVSKLRGTLASSEVPFWLRLLGRTDPVAYIDETERLAQAISPSRESRVVDWFSALLEHGSDLDLSSFEAQPQLLLRLVRLANQHIRFEDDLRHNGAYSPSRRDDAQRVRSMLGNALMGITGPDAWTIKMELVNDPEVAYYRDRIRAIALEKLAEDWDTAILNENGVVQLEKKHDYSPTNRIEMAALLEARISDVEDLLLGDASPRELWSTIRAERILRKALAAKLHNISRNAYQINQEAVTSDENRTDIRLSSNAAPIEAVIELKIGENGYSLSDFQEALRTQLVGKYMAPEHRRVGCLWISIASNKQWRDPEAGVLIEFEEVVDRLNVEAKSLEADLGYGALLIVRGLDLRVRN